MGLSHLLSMSSSSKRKKCSNALPPRLESGHLTGDTQQTPEAPGVSLELPCSDPNQLAPCSLSFACGEMLTPAALPGTKTQLGASCRGLAGLGQARPTTCGQLSGMDTSMLTSGLKTHSKVSFTMRRESNKNQVPSDLIVDNESTTGRTLQTPASEGRRRGAHEAQTDNKHAGRRLYRPQQLAASGGQSGGCWGEVTGTSGYSTSVLSNDLYPRPLNAARPWGLRTPTCTAEHTACHRAQKVGAQASEGRARTRPPPKLTGLCGPQLTIGCSSGHGFWRGKKPAWEEPTF